MINYKSRFLKAVAKLQKQGYQDPSMALIGRTMSPPVTRQWARKIYAELVELKMIKRIEARLEILK